MCWLPSIEDLQSARQRPRDVSSEHFGAASPQPIKSECECATETRRTYCNIFCIINFHLHLPIDPPPPKKRDEGRRRWPALLRAWASYSRSSTTDHRNYQPYQRKKEKKNTMGEKISSFVLLHDDSWFSPLSHWFVLLVLPPFSRRVFAPPRS